jgi:hypothetical protein
MEGPRVFHGQLVLPERVPHLVQLVRRWLVQAQPHKAALTAARLHIRQLHWALTLPAPIQVIRTIDDHLSPLMNMGRWYPAAFLAAIPGLRSRMD